MITATQQRSLSRTIAVDFEETRKILRSALQREGLEIICEVPFHREFKKTMGVECRRYSVLVVWSQFEAYRALLTEHEAGLLLPFNIVAAEVGNVTTVAVDNRMGVRQSRDSIGLLLVARDLEAKLQRAFAALHPADHQAGLAS